MWLGSAYDQAGNLIKAEELYRQALATNPNDPALMNDLAYFISSNIVIIRTARFSTHSLHGVRNLARI